MSYQSYPVPGNYTGADGAFCRYGDSTTFVPYGSDGSACPVIYGKNKGYIILEAAAQVGAPGDGGGEEGGGGGGDTQTVAPSGAIVGGDGGAEIGSPVRAAPPAAAPRGKRTQTTARRRRETHA